METLAVVAGLSKLGGGTSYSVPSWSSVLAKQGIRRTLVTLRRKGEELSEFSSPDQVELITVPAYQFPWLNLQWSPSITRILSRLCVEKRVEILHNHGAWLPVNHSAAEVARRFKIPYIITPHGMLTLWCFNNKPFRKRLAWWTYQKKDVAMARVIHATAQGEADELRQLGFRGQTAVIPNGLNLPDWRERIQVTKELKTALFVSRIHFKKGLLNLVEIGRAHV